ncbi:MAG: hypothetical protein ACFE7E_08750 [Candidatus Hodarchaeota archaeon]
MAEGFVGAKIVGVIMAIVGILLIAVGAASLLAFSIPGLPPEILAALAALTADAYTQIIYGLIALGIAFGLFQAQEWAAGAAAVLLLIICISSVLSFIGLYQAIGLSGIIAGLTGLSITVWLNIGILVVSIVCLVYLVTASGWR